MFSRAGITLVTDFAFILFPTIWTNTYLAVFHFDLLNPNSHDYSTVPLFLLCFHHALLCSHSQNMSGIAGKLLCICSHSISLLSEIHSHKMDKALIVPSMLLPPVLPENATTMYLWVKYATASRVYIHLVAKAVRIESEMG